MLRITGSSVLITGAGRGIGAAMALRFAAEGPTGIIVSDIDENAASDIAGTVRAAGVPAVAVRADVANRGEVDELVHLARCEFGPPDVVCSNAGIATGSGLHAGADQWERAWSVNVLGHVHLAQAVLPGMVLRRRGHLVITASAVGLLGLPSDAPYSVTKHAAVALAEWLAFTYLPRGIRVSALCPLGVRTTMLMSGVDTGHPAATAIADTAEILEPEQVADAVVAGLADERFLILPHPEVAAMHASKAEDPDAWIHTQASRRLPVPARQRDAH